MPAFAKDGGERGPRSAPIIETFAAGVQKFKQLIARTGGERPVAQVIDVILVKAVMLKFFMA